MKKLLSSFLSLALVVSLISGPAYAWQATEVTQIMNNVQLLEQVRKQMETIQNQIKQYENMIQNTMEVPQQVWNDTMGMYREMSRLYQNGQHLAINTQNLGKQWKDRFKDMDFLQDQISNGDFVDYDQKYKDWNNQTNDSIRSAMEVASWQALNLEDEAELLKRLENMSQSSEGRMQAIQVGNQLAGATVDQLHKLRQLMMADMQMKATVDAKMVEQEAVTKEAQKAFFSNDKNTTEQMPDSSKSFGTLFD